MVGVAARILHSAVTSQPATADGKGTSVAHSPHLVIVGVGHVGSDVLTYAGTLGLFGRISLIDIDTGVSRGQALDHHQAGGVPPMLSTVIESTDYLACADADVVIVAAGPSIIPNEDNSNGTDSRNGLAEVNAPIIREVMAGISAHTRCAAVILITNPLDVNVHIASTEFDYPRPLVFGTGTALDSARLRRIIADRAGVSPDSVQAFMLGEHGATAFPYLSHATIGGLSLSEAATVLGTAPFDPDEVGRSVVEAAFDVFYAKKWTSSGIARAAVSLARAVVLDQKVIAPVCTVAEGVHGFNGEVSLSLPAVVGAGGVERHLEVPLDDWEADHLRLSAESVSRIYASVAPRR